MPSKMPKPRHKGTKPLTVEELMKAGYTRKQAEEMAARDATNQLPNPKKGRPRKTGKGDGN